MLAQNAWESHVYHCASEGIVGGLGSPYGHIELVAHREKGHLLSALLRMGGHQGFSLCAMGIYGNKHSQKMGTEQGGRKRQWNRKLPQWQSGKTTKNYGMAEMNQ